MRQNFLIAVWVSIKNLSARPALGSPCGGGSILFRAPGLSPPVDADRHPAHRSVRASLEKGAATAADIQGRDNRRRTAASETIPRWPRCRARRDTRHNRDAERWAE